MTQMVQKSYKKVRFCYQETILLMEKTLRFRSLREGKTQQGTKHEEKNKTTSQNNREHNEIPYLLVKYLTDFKGVWIKS